jgi:multiple antibiotic resistance protein
MLASIFSSLICCFIIFTANSNIHRLHITPDSIRISAGIVLLISGLNTIFNKNPLQEFDVENKLPFQIAVSPLATPMIVTPAAVAVIMHYAIFSATIEGMNKAMWFALSIVMLLDFLAMYLNDYIIKIPGFMPILRLVSAGLNVVQLAAGVELIVISMTKLGLVHKVI